MRTRNRPVFSGARGLVMVVSGAIVVAAIVTGGSASVGADAAAAAPANDTVDETFSGTQDLVIETVPGGTRALVRELKALGVEVTQQFDTVLDGAAVTVTQKQLEAINATVDVVSTTVDKEARLMDITTQQAPGWNLDRIDQQNYTPSGNSAAYSYPASAGQGVTVYVIDTGFTRQNNELDGRLGTGVDFAGGDHGTPLDTSDDTSTKDCNEHGTHVAGTVASTTYGAAKLATIVPVRVFDCRGLTAGSLIVAGIEWVIEHKAASSPAVINMSLGTIGGDTRIDTATQAAIDAGITVVVAAGNGGADSYGDDACFGSTNSKGVYENGTSPARVVGAITVGASGYQFGNEPVEPLGSHQDLETYFSNYGTCVDLIAPGYAIPSLAFDNPGTLKINGTSMASPLVAGVAALYLGIHPLATPAEVQSALVAHAAADKITRAETYWPQYTGALPGYPSSRATRTANLLLNSEFLTTASGLPFAPVALTAGTAALSSVPLTWQEPLNLNGGTIDDYSVQYRLPSASGWTTFVHPATTQTGVTVTGLLPATTYQFRVAAHTAQGNGDFTEPVTKATLIPATSVPRSLAAGTATASSVPLTWTVPLTLNSKRITDYLVEYRVTGASDWSTFAHPAKATTGATVIGLSASTSYQFQVAARTATGDSAYTAAVSKSTQSGVTTAPRSLVAGTARASSVPLTWTAPLTLSGGVITDYLVQYRETGASDWIDFEHPARATTGATVTGLSVLTSYQFRVAARTAQADSSYTAAVSKSTLSGVTTAPRALVAGTARASSVPLTWTAPLTVNGGTITDYLIQYRVTGAPGWTEFEHPVKATTGATVTGLSPTTSYQFKVAARTAQADSLFSAVVSKTTRAS